jgi:hypothetical protein
MFPFKTRRRIGDAASPLQPPGSGSTESSQVDSTPTAPPRRWVSALLTGLIVGGVLILATGAGIAAAHSVIWAVAVSTTVCLLDFLLDLIIYLDGRRHRR